MNKLLNITLILAGLSISSLGMASERHDGGVSAYVGGGVGYYRINDDQFLDEDNSLKDNRSAFRGYLGLEAGRVFSMEAAYIDFGNTSDDTADMELTGLSGAVLVNIPVFKVVSPYGKVGVMYWDRTRSLGPFSSSDDGNDLFYGLGTRFALMSNFDMRVEYERYGVDDMDIDMASVNFQFRF